MYVLGMDPQNQHFRLLTVFAQYGFRKTAMTDLAEAAAVSRQTLYNRFRTKEAVLDWAVAGMAETLERAAIAELDAPEASLEDRIVAFFSEWIGALAPLLHGSPHGAEILGLSVSSAARDDPGAHEAARGALSRHLRIGRAAAGAEAADEMTYALYIAAKGLLLVSDDHAAFDAGMRRIVRVMTGKTNDGV